MELEKLLKTKKFLDDIAISVKNIIFAAIPRTTPEEREDIEQEVKLKIWRQAANGKKIDNLRSYLWRIVYTTALDILEERIQNATAEDMKAKAESLFISQVQSASPEFLLEAKEMKDLIQEAVGSLPDRRRTVLQLWLSDMRLEEIADFLGWKLNQVRHLLYRGIEDLKEKVRERAGFASQDQREK